MKERGRLVFTVREMKDPGKLSVPFGGTFTGNFVIALHFWKEHQGHFRQTDILREGSQQLTSTLGLAALPNEFLGQPVSVAERWAKTGMPVVHQGRSVTPIPRG